MITGPERELALDASDGMDFLCARQLVERHLGEAERLRLARLDGLGHGAPSLLERDLGIDAVQLVQIDDIRPETLQAVVDRRSHVLGTSIARDVELHPVGGETDLRSEKRALPMPDE